MVIVQEGSFWAVLGNLGSAVAGAVVILVVVFYFQDKRQKQPAINDDERKAEERGEIRERLKNLEAMKEIVERNQGLILEMAKDNQKLIRIFLEEFRRLEVRVATVEKYK